MKSSPIFMKLGQYTQFFMVNSKLKPSCNNMQFWQRSKRMTPPDNFKNRKSQGNGGAHRKTNNKLKGKPNKMLLSSSPPWRRPHRAPSDNWSEIKRKTSIPLFSWSCLCLSNLLQSEFPSWKMMGAFWWFAWLGLPLLSNPALKSLGKIEPLSIP